MLTLPAMLAEIDAKRRALVADIAVLSATEQQWRASPEQWSAVDIVEHLVRSEQVVFGDLATAERRPAVPARLADRGRRLLVELALRTGIRVSVPDAAMRPTGTASFAFWCAQWDAQHDALMRFLVSLDATGRRRRIFRHPVAGPLNARDALRLLDAHLRTHRRQFERWRATARVARFNAPLQSTDAPPDHAVANERPRR